MPLETGTFVSDLVSSNPAHSDSVGAADSHLRLIKACLLSTFTGITGVVTATHTQLNAAVAACVTGLAQAVHIAGSVGAPGVSFLGSLTTGLYSPAANQVAISTNGTQALLVKADQSVTFAAALLGGTGQLGLIGEPRLWLGSALPAGNFGWLNGQTLNRAANPVLFGLWGTTYGVGLGDGLTFSAPNFQGVTPVGRATMGGAADPGLVTNAGITTLGSILGEGKHTLSQPELPAVALTFAGNLITHGPVATSPATLMGTGGFQSGTSGGTTYGSQTPTVTIPPFTPTGAIAVTGGGNVIGSGTAHNVVQPSIVCNWITLLG